MMTENAGGLLSLTDQTAMEVIAGGGMALVSGCLLFLSGASKLDFEQFEVERKRLEKELAPFRSLIANEIEPQFKNGNQIKMLRNIEKLIEVLEGFIDRHRKLADDMQKEIEKGTDERAWSATVLPPVA